MQVQATLDATMTAITIRAITPQDRAWLVDAHRELYARHDGFDDSFGTLVDEIVDDFLAGHDPQHEAGWIAQQGETRLGSIFCVRLTEDTAKLRLFLLLPEARGQGLGRQMLETCMTFARNSGYLGMQLWTHESHVAACALYRRAGWHLESAKPVHSFGQNLIEQSWIYRF